MLDVLGRSRWRQWLVCTVYLTEKSTEALCVSVDKHYIGDSYIIQTDYPNRHNFRFLHPEKTEHVGYA